MIKGLAAYGGPEVHDYSLSQWYRVTFSEILLSEPLLWRVALEYLLHCGSSGRALLENVIAHIPLDSESKKRKLISFCEINGLKSSKLNILLVLAKQAFDCKRFGEASIIYIYHSTLLS